MQEAGRQGFFRARAAGWWGLYAEALQANSTAKINWTWIAVGYEYSTDNGRTWSTYTSGTTVTLAAIGDRVCFRAQTAGNSVTGDSNFVFSGRVAVGGSIMSLLSQTEITELPTSNSETFQGLFRDGTYGTNTSLVDASALSLPATTLTAGCYNSMFVYQRSLTAAPALPATTLAQECYRGMFGYCSSLTTAPALPATSLARQCYGDMFTGCTALTTAPALPATTANYRCYQSMFRGCTSLTAAPALPATLLGSECYNYMFQNCTSLTAAPTLPATTVESSSYANMFEGCTALVTAPALPATTLAPYCYESMFMGCTSLTAAPSLPATRCYYFGCHRMFKGCTSLVTPPAIAATTLGQYCYKEMFSGCSSLATAPTLPATSLQQDCYFEMFRDCTSLTAAPALPATSMVYDCYRGMFQGCTALVTAPTLPATTLANNCYQNMFYGCTALTSCPALPATRCYSDCYHMMFAYCSSLTTPMATLPATTLASACYDTMFYYCTSLTRSPELMATDTSRATNCYSWMFWGCSNLAEVTTKQTSFSNCGAWLSGVAANGVFRCPEVLGDDSTISRGPSACPYDWAVDNGVYWGLRIEARTAGATVGIQRSGNPPSATLEYSTDNGETWQAFTIGTTVVTLAAIGDRVFFRAGSGGNTAFSNSSPWAHYHAFAFTGSVAVAGNIVSLLSQAKSAAFPASTGDYTFCRLFTGCTGLVDASALTLPTDVKTNCYRDMFNGCTGLTSAPELPATTLAESCYCGMFIGTSSLTTPPALPATTLAPYCYDWMFADGSAITSAPALPATTLANYCYEGMFKGCTGLTAAPRLDATTMVTGCYTQMFLNCSNLATITTKQTSFDGCGAWVQGVAASGTFNCDQTALGDNSTISRGASACPTGWTVPAAPSGDGYFYVEARGAGAGVTWYHGSNSPVVVLDYSVDGGTTWQQFPTDGSLTVVLQNIGDRAYFRAGSGGNTRFAAYDSWYNNFSFQSAQVAIGGNIMTLLDATETTEFASADTFAFSSLFRNQGQLVDASALVLPATTLTGHCYQYMFEGCRNMTAGPQILATTVSGVDATCAYMFRYCSAMTSAPALLAATVADNCYYGMFMSCSALAAISTAQTTFDGCGAWVQGVASSGTFTCPSALGTQSTISRSDSSCPNNWTVVNT